MFKKLVPLLCVSMLSVMPNSSFAGGPDSSQQLVFNMCGGGDGELKDICRNLNSDLSYTFSSNHTLTITTPDGKQTAKWKAKGQEVYVTQPGSSSFKEASEYTFCEGQYLASYSEESGDLIAMKMQKPRSAVPGSFEQEYISYLNDNKILREADSLLNGRLKAITVHMTPQGRDVLISDQKNWTSASAADEAGAGCRQGFITGNGTWNRSGGSHQLPFLDRVPEGSRNEQNVL